MQCIGGILLKKREEIPEEWEDLLVKITQECGRRYYRFFCEECQDDHILMLMLVNGSYRWEKEVQ